MRAFGSFSRKCLTQFRLSGELGDNEGGGGTSSQQMIRIFKRIVKLLMLEIRPVFVFDGPTQELKRRTLMNRFRQKYKSEVNYKLIARKMIMKLLEKKNKVRQTTLIPEPTEDSRSNTTGLMDDYNTMLSPEEQEDIIRMIDEYEQSLAEDEYQERMIRHKIYLKENGRLIEKKGYSLEDFANLDPDTQNGLIDKWKAQEKKEARNTKFDSVEEASRKLLGIFIDKAKEEKEVKEYKQALAGQQENKQVAALNLPRDSHTIIKNRLEWNRQRIMYFFKEKEETSGDPASIFDLHKKRGNHMSRKEREKYYQEQREMYSETFIEKYQEYHYKGFRSTEDGPEVSREVSRVQERSSGVEGGLRYYGDSDEEGSGRKEEDPLFQPIKLQSEDSEKGRHEDYGNEDLDDDKKIEIDEEIMNALNNIGKVGNSSRFREGEIRKPKENPKVKMEGEKKFRKLRIKRGGHEKKKENSDAARRESTESEKPPEDNTKRELGSFGDDEEDRDIDMERVVYEWIDKDNWYDGEAEEASSRRMAVDEGSQTQEGVDQEASGRKDEEILKMMFGGFYTDSQREQQEEQKKEKRQSYQGVDKTSKIHKIKKDFTEPEISVNTTRQSFDSSHLLKSMLDILGIPYLTSLSDGEAQCSRLETDGLVDGTITEDSDAFLFGSRLVIRGLFRMGRSLEVYEMSRIESEIGLTREQLVSLSLFLGSDYSTGVRGVGIVNAMEIVEAFPTIESLSRFKVWAEKPDYWLEESVYEESKREHPKEFEYMERHKNYKKEWVMSPGFPDKQTLGVFLDPLVVKENAVEWKEPDVDKMVGFARKHFLFDDADVETFIVPLCRWVFGEKNGERKIGGFGEKDKLGVDVNSARLRNSIGNMVRIQKEWKEAGKGKAKEENRKLYEFYARKEGESDEAEVGKKMKRF